MLEYLKSWVPIKEMLNGCHGSWIWWSLQLWKHYNILLIYLWNEKKIIVSLFTLFLSAFSTSFAWLQNTSNPLQRVLVFPVASITCMFCWCHKAQFLKTKRYYDTTTRRDAHGTPAENHAKSNMAAVCEIQCPAQLSIKSNQIQQKK